MGHSTTNGVGTMTAIGIRLENRGILSVDGADRVSFLQGLTSNDVRLVAPDRGMFSAFLTPQGKFLHDFFAVSVGDSLLLETDRGRLPDLLRRLKLYRLRSQVTLADVSDDWAVIAVLGDDAANVIGLSAEPGSSRALGGGVAIVDPRHAAMGVRLTVPAASADATVAKLGLILDRDPAAYERRRLALGIPDGVHDLVAEKSTLLEANYDALNAISWDKGCYMGQELTARTRYRGLVKRRLMPVRLDGPSPPPGTAIVADGKEVGEIRSGLDDRAIALLRIEAADRTDLHAGETAVRTEPADWLTAAQ